MQMREILFLGKPKDIIVFDRLNRERVVLSYNRQSEREIVTKYLKNKGISLYKLTYNPLNGIYCYYTKDLKTPIK